MLESILLMQCRIIDKWCFLWKRQISSSCGNDITWSQGKGKFWFEVVFKRRVNGLNRALKLGLNTHLYMCDGLQRQIVICSSCAFYLKLLSVVGILLVAQPEDSQDGKWGNLLEDIGRGIQTKLSNIPPTTFKCCLGSAVRCLMWAHFLLFV